MKNLSHITLVAVFATVSLALGFAAASNSVALYSVAPCVFLLLTAVRDYGRKTHYQLHCQQLMTQSNTETATQSLRLAA